jgi:hypothetical protein
MKKISRKKLEAIGFSRDGWHEWWNGEVFIDIRNMNIYICSQLTTDEHYAGLARGVKNETDLINLCKLING